MAQIAMLYDRSETDELGILLTAEQMGVELEYLPFHKVAFAFDSGGYSYHSLGRDYTRKLEEAQIVLNRTQSKSRRLFAAAILENIGKGVLNPLSVELLCQSKIRTLLTFAKRGVRVPKTVFVPCNVKENIGGGGVLDNVGVVSQLVTQQMGCEKVVLKPDAGTHGRGVRLSENRKELEELLRGLEPSITNPVGVVAQEFVPKWFYDLRVIVRKENGKSPACYENALARGGFKEFRTNTFLGNMVFKARLPLAVRREAEKCAEVLGGSEEAWVIALDAMPWIRQELRDEEEGLRESFVALEEPFGAVNSVKRRASKKQDFIGYTKAITKAYKDYMAAEAYSHVEAVINDALRKAQDSVYFHEGNACPEFWEQTRVVAGINPAKALLDCAISLIDT